MSFLSIVFPLHPQVTQEREKPVISTIIADGSGTGTPDGHAAECGICAAVAIRLKNPNGGSILGIIRGIKLRYHANLEIWIVIYS